MKKKIFKLSLLVLALTLLVINCAHNTMPDMVKEFEEIEKEMDEPVPEYISRKPDLLTLPYNGYQPSPSPSYEFPVRLLKYYEGQLRFFCTGFVISDEYLITAAHCVTDRDGLINDDIHVHDLKGRDTGVVVQAASFNGRMDYAIVRGNFHSFKRAPVITDRVELNSPYYLACGFPFGQKDILCVPVVITGNYLFFFSATGFIYPGMSGGPVIDPETGEVIALNSAVGVGFVMLSPLVGIFDSLGVGEE